MQRSSSSVGALAAALAKAQAEIANPERSLTATIVSPFPREGSRTFRYAPCLPGLIWSASVLASTRSQRCNRPRSTATAG